MSCKVMSSKMSSFPASCSISNIVKINDYEFVCATNKYTTSAESDVEHGLYKYNTLNNQWTLFFGYPPEFTSDNHNNHRICFDKTNNCIYLYQNRDKMVLFDLNTLKMDTHKTKSIGDYPAFLMVNDECHIILGHESKYHYKWNSTLNQVEVKFEFLQPQTGIYRPAAVHIKSQNKLLLFGYDGTDVHSDEIWEYDMNDSCPSWRKLNNIKLPSKIDCSALVLSKHEDYLIIFGGESEEWLLVKNIFILDLNSKIFYESKLKLLHGKTLPKAVLMNDDERNHVLLDGFVRNISKEHDMNIPYELIQILHVYFDAETIYLLEDKSNLYMLELSDILKDKSSTFSIDCFEEDSSIDDEASW